VARDAGCGFQYAKTRRLEHSSEQRRFCIPCEKMGLNPVWHRPASFYDSNFSGVHYTFNVEEKKMKRKKKSQNVLKNKPNILYLMYTFLYIKAD
jgi:hypothetical protein